jgi:hypothetical protein
MYFLRQYLSDDKVLQEKNVIGNKFQELVPEKENRILTCPCESWEFILFIYLSTFIAHYPRVSSKRFTFTLTLLAMLPG